MLDNSLMFMFFVNQHKYLGGHLIQNGIGQTGDHHDNPNGIGEVGDKPMGLQLQYGACWWPLLYWSKKSLTLQTVGDFYYQMCRLRDSRTCSNISVFLFIEGWNSFASRLSIRCWIHSHDDKFAQYLDPRTSFPQEIRGVNPPVRTAVSREKIPRGTWKLDVTAPVVSREPFFYKLEPVILV